MFGPGMIQRCLLRAVASCCQGKGKSSGTKGKGTSKGAASYFLVAFGQCICQDPHDFRPNIFSVWSWSCQRILCLFHDVCFTQNLKLMQLWKTSKASVAGISTHLSVEKASLTFGLRCLGCLMVIPQGRLSWPSCEGFSASFRSLFVSEIKKPHIWSLQLSSMVGFVVVSWRGIWNQLNNRPIPM